MTRQGFGGSIETPGGVMNVKCLLVFAAAVSLRAELTVEQKVADFQQIATLYAKHYGPYEWKRIARDHDLLDIGQWLQRVRQSRDDLDYLEIIIEYVSRLDDAHVTFSFPSVFSASLPMSVDIYDGKVLIDAINRAQLPASAFPFQVGDELVEFDGLPVEEWIERLSKFAAGANPRTTRRTAAGRIVSRAQSRVPRAHEVGELATLIIRRASTGELETYQIQWTKNGTPLLTLGKFPSPFFAARQAVADEPVDPEPAYLRPLRLLGNVRVDPADYGVLGIGARTPIFAPPAGFAVRLGTAPTDFFLSGVYQSEGFRIGFIRIPSFSPPDTALALAQFRNEMAFFNQNTDGLVIDDMRNPGGLVSFCQSLLQLVFPTPFRTLGFEIRATASWHAAISSALASARLSNAPAGIIEQYSIILNDIETALREDRGMTGPLPLNATSLDLVPAPGAYTKPLIVLTDEFSASGGDFFPAVIQDNGRGPIFGYRTMGAGGSVVNYFGGSYSEGTPRVTVSLMNRKNPIVTDDHPTAPYVENIGVRPDIVEDYMTRDNLVNSGRPFVASFTAAIVAEIRRQSGE
jgi:hypothetical protein